MGNSLARDAPDGGLTKKELERMHRRWLSYIPTLSTAAKMHMISLFPYIEHDTHCWSLDRGRT